ncbi:MAG: hypothetical protein ACI89P_001127, partial [Colwellia sp.]|jgi:hypothetical protein
MNKLASDTTTKINTGTAIKAENIFIYIKIELK